jgi:manganese transport protein
MPHNLYLHSSIVQTRKYDENAAGKREAVRYAFVDSTIALSFALVHQRGHPHRRSGELPHERHAEVAEIQDAYKLPDARCSVPARARRSRSPSSPRGRTRR